MTGLKQWRRRGAVWLTALALLAVPLPLSGCDKTVQKEEVQQEEQYTLSQIMTIAATERNRYQKVYTSQIWEAVTDENGTTMKDMLLAQVKTFLEDLGTMDLLARERGIEISGTELDRLHRLGQAYFQELTKGDLEYIQVTEQEIISLYEKYYLANKLVSELTKDVDLEISDSKAKVIDILQIVMDSLETAQQVHQEAMAEDADFEALAKSYSVSDEIQRTLGRGEESSAYEEAAFALEDGQVSPLVTVNGKYYIIKCVNSYNEEETLIRKSELSLAKKDQAFRSIYDSFQAENRTEIPDSLWSQVTFDGGEECTTTNFFDLYKEYFPE